MIACADMKNVYNHASRPINEIYCALYQCVRVVPVPAWLLKLGTTLAFICSGDKTSVTWLETFKGPSEME